MKVKHGKSQEITNQLSERAATTFAQWIGCATVIYNQKTVQSTNDYAAWLAAGANPSIKPLANQQVAYLCESLPFLKEVPAQIRRNAGSKWIEAVNAAKLGLRSPPKVKPKNKKRNCYFKCLQCGVEKNADLNASRVLKDRGIKHIRSEMFSQEKTQRKTIRARRTKKAQERASSGCGDYVRHAYTDATICDALNSQRIEST